MMIRPPRAGSTPLKCSPGMREELTPELERALAEYGASKRAVPPRDTAHAYATFSSRISQPSKAAPAKRWATVALGVAALCLAILAIKYIPTQITKPSTSKFQTYVTQPGQRARFQLSDGSSVLLAAGSKLRFVQDFGKTTRDIWLDGQALFTVTKGSGAPFIVHTGDIATKVLGTSFTVRRYQEDNGVRVVVAEGKVSLGNAVLSVGEMGIARTSNDVSVTRDANIGTELAWTDGKLSFENVKLRDAIRDIERWYGITLDVQDSALLDKGITTTFAAEPASEAISLLAAALEARGEIRGSHAVLTVRRNS